MPLDRAFGEDELLGDRTVCHTLGDQSDDLDLAPGECGMLGGRCVGGGAKREPLQLGGVTLKVGRGALQRLLGEFGLGDVSDDADETGRLAGVADDDLATCAERVDPAVRADRAVFERERRSIGQEAIDRLSNLDYR